jgi:hypothetical protein
LHCTALYRRLLQEESHWLQLQQQYNAMHTSAACIPAGTDTAATDTDAAEDTAVAAAAAEAAEPADIAEAAPGSPNTTAAGAAAAASGAAAAAVGDGPVCAQQEAKVRGVQLKVEMLLALVSKMEHLVSSAETAARTLQVRFGTSVWQGCAAWCGCSSNLYIDAVRQLPARHVISVFISVS